MKILNYTNIQAYLHEFATHNVSLDMLREMVSHNGYKLDALRFIKKYEVEITVTSNKNNKTYKIKN